MVLNDVLNKFTTHLESLDRSPSTIIAYKKDLEQLFDYLQNVEKIDAIEHAKKSNLVNYVDSLKQNNTFSLKTISRKINSMKTLFKYLLSNGYLNENVSEAVQHPKYEVLPSRVLSELEYRALRDVARVNIRLYTIVEILLQTGIRIGELARLKVEDVKIQGSKKSFYIAEHASNPQREILINNSAVSALSIYLQSRPKPKTSDEYFFITKTGKPLLIRNIRTSINKAFEKAGIASATVNDIRNTFIVYQLKNGIKLEKLSEYVGHKRLTSTKKYLDLLNGKYHPKTQAIKEL